MCFGTHRKVIHAQVQLIFMHCAKLYCHFPDGSLSFCYDALHFLSQPLPQCPLCLWLCQRMEAVCFWSALQTSIKRLSTDRKLKWCAACPPLHIHVSQREFMCFGTQVYTVCLLWRCMTLLFSRCDFGHRRELVLSSQQAAAAAG